MTNFDWFVVAAYLSVVLLLGLSFRKTGKNLAEYFLAGRSFGVWAVTISIIATETSAATFIGGPDTAYRGNLAYLQTTIGAVCSRFFLAYFFIDVFYRHKVYTVYSYLAERFGRLTQLAAASIFCLGRLMGSGARLYIASLAISQICGLELFLATLLVGSIALAYGVAGGLRAVIWTDAIQGFLFLSFGLYVLGKISWELPWWSYVASYPEKLRLFDFSFNIFSAEFWMNPYTFVGALLGGFTLGLATHGTDQDMVQRMLACKTSKESRVSLILTGLIEIPVTLLFVGLGLSLWIYYQETGLPGPSQLESVFPHFIETNLPSGLRGLAVAAILAAAMSSLDSAITALASVSVIDIFQSKKISQSRLHSILWGLLLIASAILLGTYHQAQISSEPSPTRSSELLSLALGTLTLFYGPLLGAFLLGIFSKTTAEKAVLLGMAFGLLTAFYFKFFSPLPIGWTWYVFIGAGSSILVSFVVSKRLRTLPSS